MASHLKRLAGDFERQARGEGSGLSFDPARPDGEALLQIPVDLIDPDVSQPRKDPGDLAELEASIRIHGILQPIIVEPVGTRYRIIAGHRRFGAAQQLSEKGELETVPAIVRSIDEHRRLQVQIIENLHRKDLDPFELADSYQRLMDQFGFKQGQLAERLKELGVVVSRVSVNETLALTRIGPAIRQECRSADINRTVLLEVAKEPPGPRQDELWRQAREEKLSARQVRERRLGREEPVSPETPRKRRFIKVVETSELQVFLAADLGEADLERLLEELLRSRKAAGRKGWI
jgi:ParB family transcriptional regulator, chromosome partitioning protein